MIELAPGVHALGHGAGGHVRAFLIDDGGELTLVDTLFEGDGRRVLNQTQHAETLRRLAALEARVVGVGHGDPITEDAPDRVHAFAA